jgi:hypothetical protein
VAGVDAVEEHVLHAAGEQRDPPAPRPGGRGEHRQGRERVLTETGGSSDSIAASRPGSFCASARTAGISRSRW